MASHSVDLEKLGCIYIWAQNQVFQANYAFTFFTSKQVSWELVCEASDLTQPADASWLPWKWLYFSHVMWCGSTYCSRQVDRHEWMRCQEQVHQSESLIGSPSYVPKPRDEPTETKVVCTLRPEQSNEEIQYITSGNTQGSMLCVKNDLCIKCSNWGLSSLRRGLR